MRKLIYAINITLDGCCDHTKTRAEEELLEHYKDLIQGADLVYGRKTYELMVPYWPDIAKSQTESKSDIEFGQAFDSASKIVFSKSLTSAGNNTRIVRGNLQDEILKLKQQPGKDILAGGVSLPTQLAQLGLVDEYQVVIQPIVAGEGRRLLEGISLQERFQLKLVDSKTLKSGSVALRYKKP